MKLYRLKVWNYIPILIWFGTRQAAERAMQEAIDGGSDPSRCSITRYDIAYNKEGVINFLNTHCTRDLNGD